MDLSVNVMSRVQTVDSVLQFQTDDMSVFWREPLFDCYDFLDKDKGLYAKWDDRRTYLENEISSFYCKNEVVLREKQALFAKKWANEKSLVEDCFAKAFKTDVKSIFNDCVAQVSLNPVCSRFLTQHSFTVFYGTDANSFMDTAVHEMIHFLWFYLWQKHFGEDVENYETPNLIWVVSELVVDAFVKNTGVGLLISPKGKVMPAYRYFYTMHVGGELILDEVKKMFLSAPNLFQFMEAVYEYCKKNEAEIRGQME